VNKKMIASSGGYHNNIDNILNRNSFEYLVGFIEELSIYEDLNIYDIAAKYSFSIIKNHIFCDGNKRTGIESAIIFLKNNGLYLSECVDSDMIIDLALKIESGNFDLRDISGWFEMNTYSG
jgi:death-on-curing protein